MSPRTSGYRVLNAAFESSIGDYLPRARKTRMYVSFGSFSCAVIYKTQEKFTRRLLKSKDIVFINKNEEKYRITFGYTNTSTVGPDPGKMSS